MKMKILSVVILSALLFAVPAFAVHTAITVQAPAQFGGIQNVTLTAADSANGMMFLNDGKTVLVVINNDVAAKTVTVVSVPDENGRTGDIVLVVPAAAGGFPGIAITDQLPTALFTQQSTDAGNVYVSFSAATNLKVAAVRIP
jgi:hypothetical protein